MKPYPGKNLQECQDVYNYCLSRARSATENVYYQQNGEFSEGQ